MTDPDILACVKATALVLALPLDEQRALRVTMHLARTAEMARQLDAFVLDVEEEPAEIYCPAPFPLAANGYKTS